MAPEKNIGPVENDDLVFAAEANDSDATLPTVETWTLMIVDDDEEIHTVTRLALEDFFFAGKGLTFIDAYSANEAKEILRDRLDIALILLDVVMETDHAGLDVTKFIREELGNHLVRIILRTGQPGSAPEKQVIIDYDINDYKEKTELTSQKLFTAVVASLRAYRHLSSIEFGRKGLEKIIEASPSIFTLESLDKFVAGVFGQLVSLLQLSDNSLYAQTTGFATVFSEGDLKVILGTGIYEEKAGQRVLDVVPDAVMQNIRKAATIQQSLYCQEHCVIYFQAKNIGDNLIYLEQLRLLDKWDIDLLELFCKNITTAYENVTKFQQLVNENRALEQRRDA